MIPENIPINTYNGDNSTILFKFNFLINKEEEILVTYVDKNDNKILLELNKDYSVKEIGKIDGSYVKFPLEGSTYTTLKEDEKIILELNLPIVQNKLFSQEIPFDLSSLEYSLDYLTRLIQILQSKIDNYTVNNSEVLNNPYTLFDSKYSEYPLYNSSWLLSKGQFHSGEIYKTAYEALLIEEDDTKEIGQVYEITNGNYIKRGLPVKSKNAMIIRGNPTIENDWISNFSATNFIEVPAPTEEVTSFRIECEFTLPQEIPSLQGVYGQKTTNITTPQIQLQPASGSVMDFNTPGPGSKWVSGYDYRIPYTLGSTYKTIYEYRNKQLTAYVQEDGGEWQTGGPKDAPEIVWTTGLCFGKDQNSLIFEGKIRLSSIIVQINDIVYDKIINEATDYDFIVDKLNKTFRLPRKTKFNSITVDELPVIGNGIAMGLTNGKEGLGGLGYDSAYYSVDTYSTFYGQKLPFNSQNFVAAFQNADALGVTTDPEKSGLIALIPRNDLNLYYYIGDCLNDLSTIQANADVILEKLNKNITPDEIAAPFNEGGYYNSVEYGDVLNQGNDVYLGWWDIELSNIIPFDGYAYDVYGYVLICPKDVNYSDTWLSLYNEQRTFRYFDFVIDGHSSSANSPETSLYVAHLPVNSRKWSIYLNSTSTTTKVAMWRLAILWWRKVGI